MRCFLTLIISGNTFYQCTPSILLAWNSLAALMLMRSCGLLVTSVLPVFLILCLIYRFDVLLVVYLPGRTRKPHLLWISISFQPISLQYSIPIIYGRLIIVIQVNLIGHKSTHKSNYMIALHHLCFMFASQAQLFDSDWQDQSTDSFINCLQYCPQLFTSRILMRLQVANQRAIDLLMGSAAFWF